MKFEIDNGKDDVIKDLSEMALVHNKNINFKKQYYF
jgi:hypothetical protein